MAKEEKKKNTAGTEADIEKKTAAEQPDASHADPGITEPADAQNADAAAGGTSSAGEPNAADAAQAASDTNAEALAKAQEELAKARGELADSKDRYLRLAAEYDNYKKRTAREKDELYSVSIQAVVTSLLPVLDALDAAKLPEDESEASGLVQLKKLLLTQMEKLGVTEIAAQGAPFDPAYHNAVMHVEDQSLGENVVAEVFQKGYQYKERVIRVAMVKVAN